MGRAYTSKLVVLLEEHGVSPIGGPYFLRIGISLIIYCLSQEYVINCIRNWEGGLDEGPPLVLVIIWVELLGER